LTVRKSLSLAMVGVGLLFVLLIVGWAVRPLSDSVPVGTDWTPTLAVPPKPQVLVSQRVTCNTHFSGRAVDGSSLPALTPQPKDHNQLQFTRPPCELVHSDAQRLLMFDSLFAAAVLGGLVAFAAHERKASAAHAGQPALI
jgi:hypothetical protein